METRLTIESLQNPRVKSAVKLRKSKVRSETGRTLVEGFREILRAVQNSWHFIELYYCPEFFHDEASEELVERISNENIPVFRCSDAVFRRLSYRDTPDGLMALSPLVGTTLDELQLPPRPLLLVAENLEKPGNLGTLLRTADAAGADAVIVCGRKTDINNPNVIRASIGTLFYMPVAVASSQETLDWLRQHGIRTAAALPDAEMEYTEADMQDSLAIAVGAEDGGLTPEWLARADLHLRIPMLGKNDSLNVSTASAILLYEAVRQRRRPK